MSHPFQATEFRLASCLHHSLKKACTAAAVSLAVLPAMAQETFKLGIVSFLSGQAAESFGVPAINGAKVLIDAFNKGAGPAPYNKVGFGGMKIEPPVRW
jgi:branched-chain amino acid transport system substrate-binding protein